MNKYDKMLIAIKEADLNCYSNKGDWLYIANSKDTKKMGSYIKPKLVTTKELTSK